MRIRLVSSSLVGMLLTTAALAAGAQQDTTKLRKQTTTAVSSAGEVSLTRYNAPAGDTAITRLQNFLAQYPQSALRPRAMFQLAELLVRRADEQFAQTQRAGNASDTSSAHPDYRDAISKYEDLIANYPTFERRDAVAYTLGTLYAQQQRYADAIRVFETIASDSSAFKGEALFRLGDAYLIYAEAQLRGGGGSKAQALTYVNALRTRAYGDASGNITDAELTLPFILDERGRELLWEGHRRTDLIRFGQFTGGTYIWAWKGGTAAGGSTAAHLDLYPLPANELVANPNLRQNTGY